MSPAIRHAHGEKMARKRGTRASDDVNLFTRLAPIRTPTASTWNAETREFFAVLSRGAPVERFDSRGAYVEILEMSPGAVTLPASAPLLDSHARDSLERVLGHATAFELVGGELRGRVRLSRHNPQAVRLAADIGDGAAFGMSIGYRVTRWTERTNPDTRRRERIAASWELLEASLVSVAADPNAGMRGSEMPGHSNPPDPGVAPVATATPPITENTRAAINAEIRTIARTAGLDTAWADTLVDRDASADEARRNAFEAMRSRSAPGAGVRNVSVTVTGHDANSPEFRVRALGEAMYARVNPTHTPSDAARAFVGFTTADTARECLRAAGVSTTSLAPATVIERALHTTSDFPLIMGDAVGRVLRDSYQAVPSAVRQLARRVTSTDFRERHSLRLTGGLKLEKVNEAGEFKAGTIFESGASYKIDTFGRVFGLTRQAIVNDNLGAFNDVPRIMGQAAANFESAFLADLVASNPAMSDGKAVFHADHGNLAAPGTEITLDALSAARRAMRLQKDEAGELVPAVPRFLIVAPDRETEAEQRVAEITAATPAEVNPFSNLIVVVEPRLPLGAWHVVADPALLPSLEYSYLAGEEGPQIITQAGFWVDGVQFRVRLDFGGGWTDWRGWYRNAGPA